MIKIQTKTAILYNVRDHKFGKIIIQAEKQELENGYNITTIDCLQKITSFQNESGEAQELTFEEPISTKVTFLPTEIINAIFGQIEAQIPEGLTYKERQEKAFALGTLYFIQNNFIKDENGAEIPGKTIYNLDPNQWEIKTEN